LRAVHVLMRSSTSIAIEDSDMIGVVFSNIVCSP